IDPGRARAADQRHRRAHRPGVHGRRVRGVGRSGGLRERAPGSAHRAGLPARDRRHGPHAPVGGRRVPHRPSGRRGRWPGREAGPHRLTDPETLDVASSGADLEVIGPDFLVRRLTRGRTHLLRVARDGAVTTVLDGDVSVEGADAVAIDSGTLVAAALSTPDTRGALVAVEGQSPPRTLVDTGQALRDAGLAVPRELEIEGRGGYP